MDQKRRLLIVNIITFARVPFVVLFMVLAIIHAYKPELKVLAVLGTVSLAVASLTDLYDGKLARKWEVVSKFGAMAPISGSSAFD